MAQSPNNSKTLRLSKRLGLRDSLKDPKQKFHDNDYFKLTPDPPLLEESNNSLSVIKVTNQNHSNDFSETAIVSKGNSPVHISSDDLLITVNNPTKTKIIIATNTSAQNKSVKKVNFNMLKNIQRTYSSLSQSTGRPPSSPTHINNNNNSYSFDEDKKKLTTQSSVDSQEFLVNNARRISFLTVPGEQSRRPSTADVVIQKLQVEKIDGGGLTISGFALAANCHISLITFGFLFLLAGIVLSYVGFASSDNYEETSTETFPQATSVPLDKTKESGNQKQIKVVGPTFMILGITMLLIGITLCGISRKITRDEKEKRVAISNAQLNQLENNFNQSHVHVNMSPIHTSAPGQNQAYPVLSLRRGSWWMEPTPIEFPQYGSEGGATFNKNNRSPSPLLDNTCVLTPREPAIFSRGQSASSKRISSSHIRLFQCDEEPLDIATFPVEDSYTTSYANRRFSNEDKLGRRESIKSEPNSQIFEVSEAVEREDPLPLIPIITVSNVSESPLHQELSRELPDNSYPQATANLPLIKNGVALPRLSRHSKT